MKTSLRKVWLSDSAGIISLCADPVLVSDTMTVMRYLFLHLAVWVRQIGADGTVGFIHKIPLPFVTGQVALGYVMGISAGKKNNPSVFLWRLLRSRGIDHERGPHGSSFFCVLCFNLSSPQCFGGCYSCNVIFIEGSHKPWGRFV